MSMGYLQIIQSNPVKMDTERAIESDQINGVSVLNECKGFLSRGTEQTFHNSDVSVLRGLYNSRFDCTFERTTIQPHWLPLP